MTKQIYRDHRTRMEGIALGTPKKHAPKIRRARHSRFLFLQEMDQRLGEQNREWSRLGTESRSVISLRCLYKTTVLSLSCFFSISKKRVARLINHVKHCRLWCISCTERGALCENQRVIPMPSTISPL
ncbi:hypothetical protein K474DRAFT_314661 [Panus rudis PR-1116 ss-1]|nr:hypothetical protein K474DRAFT_314661 [Panus rudis PR-1116 ss-1]